MTGGLLRTGDEQLETTSNATKIKTFCMKGIPVAVLSRYYRLRRGETRADHFLPVIEVRGRQSKEQAIISASVGSDGLNETAVFWQRKA